MVNKETLIKALTEKNYLITKDDDFIPYEIFEILHSRQYKAQSQKVIETKEGGYLCEFKCARCGEIHKEILSTTAIVDSGRALYCKECMKINKEEKKQEETERYRRYEEERDKSIKYKTEYAISKLLNPDYSFSDETKYYEKFDECSVYMTDDAIQYAKRLNYKDYLRTPYWDAIRSKKLHQANYKCELCGKSDTLQVHHRCYDNRGNEFRHMNDLIVLCKDCHEKFHDKITTKK